MIVPEDIRDTFSIAKTAQKAAIRRPNLAIYSGDHEVTIHCMLPTPTAAMAVNCICSLSVSVSSTPNRSLATIAGVNTIINTQRPI